MEINIMDYLSNDEITEICKEEVRTRISRYVQDNVTNTNSFKGFFTNACYMSLSGEFLDKVFNSEPELLKEIRDECLKVAKSMDYISESAMFGYDLNVDSYEKQIYPLRYQRVKYLNNLIMDVMKENEAMLREKIKEIALERVTKKVNEAIDNENLDISWLVLDALKKGLTK
nr:hypothetical protein [uncultured Campylobacter sp.]